MSFEDLPIGDQVSIEIDRRKVQKLVDDGIILPDELRNAPLVQIIAPENPQILSVTCQTDGCGLVFKTMEDFEVHAIEDHDIHPREADEP